MDTKGHDSEEEEMPKGHLVQQGTSTRAPYVLSCSKDATDCYKRSQSDLRNRKKMYLSSFKLLFICFTQKFSMILSSGSQDFLGSSQQERICRDTSCLNRSYKELKSTCRQKSNYNVLILEKIKIYLLCTVYFLLPSASAAE